MPTKGSCPRHAEQVRCRWLAGWRIGADQLAEYPGRESSELGQSRPYESLTDDHRISATPIKARRAEVRVPGLVLPSLFHEWSEGHPSSSVVTHPFLLSSDWGSALPRPDPR